MSVEQAVAGTSALARSTAAVAVLQARGLAFGYGTRHIFSDIDLDIAAREIVCLIGPSGCGKSTLLRILAGLATPGAGQIRLHGEQDPQSRASTAVVFQNPALLPWLDVAGNVAFGLDFACRGRTERAARAQRVALALAQVGLSEHARRRPSALSGGMAQRVSLARALARDPALIFLDEPFSALDAVNREAMQDLLLALAHRQQAAVLLVTHDIDEALRVADRVVLMAGSPARLAGSWQPDGSAPRVHRSAALNALREDILTALAGDRRLCA